MNRLILLICLQAALVFFPGLKGFAAETAFENHYDQSLLERASREVNLLTSGPQDGPIARLVTRLMEQSHFSQRPLDESVSSEFLDRYFDALDNFRFHFLQSDLEEFEPFRSKLHDLTYRGDTSPGRLIFARFLERLQQRALYVADLLENETFEFTADERYNLDRRKAERPKDLAEAKELWRRHLRYEFLQEKLNEEEPAEIKNRIYRRYVRLLTTFQDLDHDDVLELYLSALTRVYDPHSDFMGRAQLANFAISMKLSLGGIGAMLRSEDGYCRIVSLVPGGPAMKSGEMREDDRIIAVAQGDEEPVDVVDMPLRKVVEKIRGPKGTEVRLTIIPADAEDPSVRKVVRLIRDEVKLEDQQAKAKLYEFPVPGEEDKTMRLGLIDLPSFYANLFDSGEGGELKSTTADVAKLIRKLKTENVDGIVLDLRRNSGGSLEEAISLTGLFIKEGPVVQVSGPNERPQVYRDESGTVLYDGPLLVLTSRFSASASEILAGALQDYGRALVVGDVSTHGKGTVQSLIELGRFMRQEGGGPQNLGALKLTIRKFYRATGSSTQKEGIIPDIILPSRNNHAEVGEAALDNPLPWETIAAVPFKALDRIQKHVDELQSRSAKRIENDQDFAYVFEDIEQLKKALADRSVSLNLEERLREKEEAEARTKKRREELRARPVPVETVYEISLKQAEEPGLPDPMETPAVASSQTPGHSGDEFDLVEPGDEPGDAPAPTVDPTLKEAKNILADFIRLSSQGKAIAVTQ